MFFSYIAFWSSCRVTPDLGEVHARRVEFGHVFPEGRNLEGGMLRRRNPGRNPPEDRIEVWVFKKRRNPHLSPLFHDTGHKALCPVSMHDTWVFAPQC